MAKKFGADIGYSTVRIYLPKAKQIKTEPAVCAVSIADGSVSACGNEALSLFERIPGSVKIVHPFSGEMMPEGKYVTAYFNYVIKNLRLKGASALLSFSGAHDEEAESIYVKAIQKAGAGNVSVVDAAFAAARGCSVLNVGDSAVVNIGASVTDMACFSRGEQVASDSCSFAGNAFDKAIISSIIKSHRYRLSRRDAEDVKIKYASLSGAQDGEFEVRGMRPALGLPKIITLKPEEICAACEPPFEGLADAIAAMVRSLKVEPDKIILTGGSSRLSGLPNALAPLLLLPIEIAENPENAVINGISRMIEEE